MPSLDQRFETYIAGCAKNNLHPGLTRVYDSLPSQIEAAPHMILHGPPGVGKYTQALRVVSRYSPTELRYEKLMHCGDDRQSYSMRISDVHFEVDMETLGCHSRTLWSTIHTQITDSIATRSPPAGFIICRNFHKTHKELLEVFYYYMSSKAVKLILLCDHVGFLSRRMFERCFRIPIPRAPQTRLRSAKLPAIPVINLRSTQADQQGVDSRYKTIVADITQIIVDEEPPGYIELRNMFYDLLILQFSVADCVWEIIADLCQKEVIPNDRNPELYGTIAEFFRLYNNNYRPIYHLERLMYTLRRIVHPHRYMLGIGPESGSDSA